MFRDRFYVPKAIADKVVRDGKIMAFLKRERERGLQDRVVVVVSSSFTLQRLAENRSAQLGTIPAVWPVGALAYMLSLVPGVRLTLSALRTCLFAEGEDPTDRVTELAFRVIRYSAELELGYSRRTTLKRHLHDELAKIARERGQQKGELIDEIHERTPESRDILATAIANAVDKIIASRSEREVEELRQRIVKLQDKTQR